MSEPAAPSYLEQVIRDFQTLGLYYDGGPPTEPSLWCWQDLFDLLDTTKFIGPAQFERLGTDDPEMATNVGSKALELLKASVKFSDKERLKACYNTEPKLIRNVSPESVASPETYSPLVLIRDGEPIGIVKTYGEKSCYGLATELDAGIIEGCFSQPTPFTELGAAAAGLPKTTAAWSLPVEKAGVFTPLRFSAFTMPESERAKLARNEYAFQEWRRCALVYSHDYVLEQARNMLPDAVALELEAESPAMAA